MGAVAMGRMIGTGLDLRTRWRAPLDLVSVSLKQFRTGSAKLKATMLGAFAVMMLGYSAEAARRAITAHDAPAALPARASGFEAADHFPGAAYFYAVDDGTGEIGTPGIGATGTTALPALPIEPVTDLSLTDPSVHPARPFDMAVASAEDRWRALQCLTAAVYYEAASESDDGQRAVAQVILNRVRHPAFPATVCGVVYQGSERASGCQFSFACDDAMARPASRGGWIRAAGVASDMLSGRVEAAIGTATHYHTYAVTPAWNRSLVMTAAIGAHFFHRWQGYWGTPAAFSRRYAGHEPMPGPHARLPAQQAAPVVTTAGVINASATTPSPDAGGESSVVLAAAPQDNLPQSPVLEKWKDSGKPLR